MSELLKVNVNDHTEKKNNLTYLSWAWAWAEVLKIDPDATWEPTNFGADGEAFQMLCRMDDGTALVGVTVFMNNRYRRCMLPVMDHKNKAIPKPNAFDVNKAQMRCLAKAIAMHGLGLYIYAGEDLPEGEETPQRPASPIPESFRSSATMGSMEALSPDEQTYIRDLAMEVLDLVKTDPKAAVDRIEAEKLDDNQKIGLWTLLDSKTRSAIKKAQQAMREAVTA